PLMVVTPACSDTSQLLAGLTRSLDAGVDLVQFRAPGLAAAEFETRARAVIALCRSYGAQVMLNCSPEVARSLAADGVHLSQSAFRRVPPRSLDPDSLTGISCHSAEELQAALAQSPDYLLLGPVMPTASHPGMAPLGWESFAALMEACPVPVYAIGGLSYRD